MADDQTTKFSEDEWKRRWDEYSKHRDQTWEDIKASSDEFDKNLLTFSSGALGLSLAFIKDIVKLESAVALPWLYCSWAFLSACIILTIFSYRFSIWAQEKRFDDLVKYFLEDDKTAFNRKTVWSRALEVCANVGAIFLLAGVITTVVFVSKNVSQEHKMADQRVSEGRAPLKMTPTNNLERGRAPLPMTPVQSQGTIPAAQPSSTASPARPVTGPIAPLKKD